MNTLNNKLVEIPLKYLPELRDMYRVDWPTYITACYTIDTCIRWFDKDPNLKDIKIYCLNGKWEEDGTYVMVRETTYFFNTLQPSCENLKIALSLIDWSKPSSTSCYSDTLRSTVIQVLNEQGIKNVSEFATNIYFVPRDQALKMIKRVHVPEGIILKPLDKSHVTEIYEKYPHKAEDSFRTFELLIELNPSMGAFSDTGELLAWVLRFEDGSTSMLQVAEKHRGKGYPAYVLAGLSKLLVDQGYDILGNVVTDNFRSLAMSKSYGLEKIGKAYWVWTGEPYHMKSSL